MCGRFTQHHAGDAIVERFAIERMLFDVHPRYNIAPSQRVGAVVIGDDGRRELRPLQWGLVPFWADDPSIGNRMINARAESVAEKPAYRAAFKKRRCLVPADGFYEWRKGKTGKTPMLIRLGDDELFAFAGLWEQWRDKETDDELETFTIITTEPNALCRKIHNRMPVILKPDDEDVWLGADAGDDADRLTKLLRPYPSKPMKAHAVSRRVNSPANDEAALIEPADEAPGDAPRGLFE